MKLINYIFSASLILGIQMPGSATRYVGDLKIDDNEGTEINIDHIQKIDFVITDTNSGEEANVTSLSETGLNLCKVYADNNKLEYNPNSIITKLIYNDEFARGVSIIRLTNPSKNKGIDCELSYNILKDTTKKSSFYIKVDPGTDNSLVKMSLGGEILKYIVFDPKQPKPLGKNPFKDTEISPVTPVKTSPETTNGLSPDNPIRKEIEAQIEANKEYSNSDFIIGLLLIALSMVGLYTIGKSILNFIKNNNTPKS